MTNKSAYIQFRLTDYDKKFIQKIAKDRNISISNFIMYSLFKNLSEKERLEYVKKD